nr:TPA_asm: hypothetical protein [Pseudoglobivirus]
MSLDDYFKRLDSLNEEERRSYLREDYLCEDPDGLLCDYQDFIDEWNYTRKEIQDSVWLDFINEVFVQPGTPLECAGHYHFLTIKPKHDTDEVFSPSLLRDKPCIRAHLAKCAIDLSQKKLLRTAAIGSAPVASYIADCVRSRLVAKGLPGNYLSYDEFIEKWTETDRCPSAAVAATHGEISDSLEYHNALIEQSKGVVKRVEIDLLKQEGVAPIMENPPTHFKEPEVIIDDIEEIYRDHGFHAFLRLHCRMSPRNKVPPKRNRPLNKVNQLRRRAHGQEFVPETCLKHMAQCPRCTSPRYVRRKAPDKPSIFYAPPGSGKTTCLRDERIVAIDSDWLYAHGTFHDVLLPFLKMGIAVVTNQYHILENCGYKVYSYVNPHLATPTHSSCETREIVERFLLFAERFPRDFVIYLDDSSRTHMGNRLTELLICRYIQSQSIQLLRKAYHTGCPRLTL